MAAPSSSSVNKSVNKGKRSPEEIIAGFNLLRNEQRNIATKLYEFDADLSEHRIVIENLKKLEGDRKCFRLVGGILVEGSIKDVLPNLQQNAEQLSQTIESFNNKLVEKGKEIVDYKDKNNIQFQAPPTSIAEEDESEEKSEGASSRAGLLAA